MKIIINENLLIELKQSQTRGVATALHLGGRYIHKVEALQRIYMRVKRFLVLFCIINAVHRKCERINITAQTVLFIFNIKLP